MYSTGKGKEINRSLFENALSKMTHRGPDGSSVFFDENIALGHNRLSVIDTSVLANQPFFSNDKKSVIVFNGEIFNYRELRSQIIANGASLQSASDTEVLLNLLNQNGLHGLNEINGFFAFAYYNFEKNEGIIARDRFGEKPMFYTINNHQLFFSSELESITPFVKEKRMDETALQFLTELNYIPAPFTFFTNVKKLLPGNFIKFSRSEISIHRYYTLTNPSAKITDEKIALGHVWNKLYTAVERRLVSDVPVAGFLSGGIDSSLVSGIAKQLNSKYETFSLGFSENNYVDESNDAIFAAKYFNINHHVIKLKNDEILNNANEILNKSDEPFGDSSIIALYSLSKQVKGKYKVVLSGDGADEVFGGYNKHKALWLTRNKNFKNGLIKYTGISHVLFPKSRHTALGNKMRKVEKMHGLLNRKEFERYWFLATFNHSLTGNIFKNEQNQNEYYSYINALKNTALSNGFEKNFEYDLQLVLPNDMLYKVDRGGMLNSLEIRSPFMDHELIEYAMSISANLKLKNNSQKYLLKHIGNNFLHPSIVNKPKHGFEVPLRNWLLGPLKIQVNELLNADLLSHQNIFDSNQIEKIILKMNSSNPGDSSLLIWTLLNFQKSWLKYFNY